MKKSFLTALFILFAIPFLAFPAAAQDSESEEHSLQIQYLDENGSQVFPTYSARMIEGEEYSVPSPASEDASPNPETVSGVMGNEDVSEIVTYSVRNPPTVYYKFEDGSEAAPTYICSDNLLAGQLVSITSPTIKGYLPDEPVVHLNYQPMYYNRRTVTYYPVFTLKINYLYSNGSKAADPVSVTLKKNDTFSYTSPSISGYVPDQAVIFGTIGEEDLTYTVRYLRSYNLKINYIYSDGSQAASSVSEALQEGEFFSFTSPNIKGYEPDKVEVSGNMPSKDLTYTVTYSPIQYILTVNYLYKDGSQAAVSYIEKMTAASSYEILSPDIPGFSPDIPIVSGAMPDDDFTITVVYLKKNEYLLTINYHYEDGSEASPPYTASVKYGDFFSVPSPAVPGFTPERSVISDKMGDADATFTVVYKPTKYLLTIKYNRQSGKNRSSGTKIAPDYTGRYMEGEKYEISSPSVMGYETQMMTISGVMPAHDVIETVSYRLAGEPVMGDMSGLLDVVSSSGIYMREYISKVLLTLVTAGLIIFAGFMVIRFLVYIINRLTRV